MDRGLENTVRHRSKHLSRVQGHRSKNYIKLPRAQGHRSKNCRGLRGTVRKHGSRSQGHRSKRGLRAQAAAQGHRSNN
eukprot:1020071-Alexandrium_andersonii.AAC.1